MKKVLREFVWRFFLLFFTFVAAIYAEEKIDLVRVDKSSRKMFLMAGPQVVKVYKIYLGKNPVGHKEKFGDNKTPEGVYILDYKNNKSIYHKSIHISYPNEKDRVTAAEKGWDPGGGITIHGQIDNSQKGEYWTEGCIGVTNEDMDEIWIFLDLPVTIIIEP
ncbi:L,D-transpeptidase family protein [uncultured Ilyobacter sp.]|uniref:L,D-transpeptidase family protein n=1 Tax=uncultured Ilyobacter sp. TaxID=544433 RepID=UPI0029C96BEE|nr:L,D-transpeptidase family protein [uncultured Ilyobacter sp.]